MEVIRSMGSAFAANWPSADWEQSRYFLLPWISHFIFTWIGFFIFMKWDYDNYKKGQLSTAKLPTRHPLNPFWWEQLRMVPLVLYNQLVVWPLVSLFVIWPIWVAQTHVIQWPTWLALFCVLPLMIVSDFLWYWSHRWMHTPFAWKHFHLMHHIAPQSAISATYVHSVEYAMFCTSVQLPFALTGFPLYVFVVPLCWGMITGGGAHSGYSGDFANGDKHNFHHTHHNRNFGLLMVMDVVFGTHWQPGDPAPPVWSEAEKIWSAYPKEYYGGGTAKVAAGDAKPGEEAETKKEAIAKVLEDNAASMESKASSTSSRRPRRSKD